LTKAKLIGRGDLRVKGQIAPRHLRSAVRRTVAGGVKHHMVAIHVGHRLANTKTQRSVRAAKRR